MDHQEFAQLLGNYGEFVGAIAVVVTLVYLAIQIRQNTASVRSSAYQTWVEVAMAELSAGQSPVMSPVIATGLGSPASLTKETWMMFGNYCHQFVLRAESTHYLRQQKSIADSICEKEFDRVATFLACAGPKQWWTAGGRTQFTIEFVDMIEQRKVGEVQAYGFTPGEGYHPASYYPDA